MSTSRVRISRSGPYLSLLTGSLLVFGVASWDLAAQPGATLDDTPATNSPATKPAPKPAAMRAAALDARIAAACAAENVPLAPRTDDAQFLRRVWLDLAGRVPSLAEIEKATVSNSGTDSGSAPGLNRAALVDQLLQSKEFASYWALLWSEYLLDRRPFADEDYKGRTLLRFLRDALAANQPYNELVAELLQGEGDSDVSGPANFLMRYGPEAAPMAGAVGQKFLGLSIQCAECHNHPHATWTQNDFWGLAAYFARLRKMNPAEQIEGMDDFSIVVERSRGELLLVDKQAQPNENGEYPMRTVFPKLPGQTGTDISKSRRAALSHWMTASDNPYFARHAVNQVWYRLMGTKLVDTLDRVPTSEQGLSAALLNDLQAEFVASGFDLKALIRSILLSEAYQRSSSTAPGGLAVATTYPVTKDAQSLEPAKSPGSKKPDAAKPDATKPDSKKPDTTTKPPAPPLAERQLAHFARAQVRPLSADQIHLSLGSALGYYYDDQDHRLAEATREEFTYDIPHDSFYELPASLRRSLALFNSEHLRGAVDVAAEMTLRLYGNAAGAEHVERLCLMILGRKPTADELERLLELAGGDSPKAGLEDVAWVLLNSAEFNTNH